MDLLFTNGDRLRAIARTLDTTYTFTDHACEIDTLTPLYTQMREYANEKL